MTQQGQKIQLQHGVLRTNCIDCLDRTNVAQFAYGLTALGQQLHALGLADTPTIDAQSSTARELMEMYEVMGNVLSRQVLCASALLGKAWLCTIVMLQCNAAYECTSLSPVCLHPHSIPPPRGPVHGGLSKSSLQAQHQVSCCIH